MCKFLFVLVEMLNMKIVGLQDENMMFDLCSII